MLFCRNPEPEVIAVSAAPEVEVNYNGGATYYVSCFPYESGEAGDLTFGAGEYITVIKKDGDWWTGTIDSRTGIFPSNYVQEVGSAGDTFSTINATDNTTATSTVQQNAIPESQNYSDDVQNQEEADTEVSEIITQSKTTDSVEDTYNRPMSSSSTTSVEFCFVIFDLISSGGETNFVISCREYVAVRKVKWLKSLHHMRQRAMSNCHCNAVNW